MTSKNYRQLLNNEYNVKELNEEDFDSTLMHFAKIYNKEQFYKIILDFSDYINDFQPSPNITETEIKEYLKYKENA